MPSRAKRVEVNCVHVVGGQNQIAFAASCRQALQHRLFHRVQYFLGSATLRKDSDAPEWCNVHKVSWFSVQLSPKFEQKESTRGLHVFMRI
jgi:hypothetical protein